MISFKWSFWSICIFKSRECVQCVIRLQSTWYKFISVECVKSCRIIYIGDDFGIRYYQEQNCVPSFLAAIVKNKNKFSRKYCPYTKLFQAQGLVYLGWNVLKFWARFINDDWQQTFFVERTLSLEYKKIKSL